MGLLGACWWERSLALKARAQIWDVGGPFAACCCGHGGKAVAVCVSSLCNVCRAFPVVLVSAAGKPWLCKYAVRALAGGLHGSNHTLTSKRDN